MKGVGVGGQDLKQACLISQTTLGHVATNALNKATLRTSPEWAGQGCGQIREEHA